MKSTLTPRPSLTMPARRIRIPFQLEFWIGAAALWLLSALILSYLVMERPPFPLARMEQLRVGMTKAEVRALLGDPVNCQGNVWKWSIGWPIVSVEFDERGRFRSWEYDRQSPFPSCPLWLRWVSL